MKKWNEIDIFILKKHYSSCKRLEPLARLLSRSKEALHIKARSLKLRRANPTSFKKGCTPYNKGTKGITPGGAYFKKGHIPANTKHFGKPYLARVGGRLDWIVQHEGKTKIYKRLIFGEIPEGFLVSYKNGLDEAKPPVKDDLALISKADNMIKNCIHNNYPTELKKAMFNLGKLKQKINEI
jgi:hypothetical protein